MTFNISFIPRVSVFTALLIIVYETRISSAWIDTRFAPPRTQWTTTTNIPIQYEHRHHHQLSKPRRRTKAKTVLFETTSKSSSSNSNVNPNHLEGITSLQNDYFALRHGQSMANVAGIIASNPDIACIKYGLSDTGKEQAREAGHVVVKQNSCSSPSDYEGILILTSDLLRAKETAEIVSETIVAAMPDKFDEDDNMNIIDNVQVVTETRLRERNFGEWDLKSDIHYKDVWEDDVIDPNHELRGVESVNSVTSRATQCIVDWDKKQQNHLIICVAHGDVLQILQTAFLKMDSSQHRSLDHLETATLRQLALQ